MNDSPCLRDLSLLGRGFTKELRSVLCCNVNLDSLSFGQLYVTILHVGQIGEVIAKGVLHIEPAAAIEFGSITTLVIDRVVGDVQVGELVQDLLGQTPNFPVTNRQFLLFHLLGF